MENENKKPVENADSGNDKLLLSDVIESVCDHHNFEHGDSISMVKCIECGEIIHI